MKQNKIQIIIILISALIFIPFLGSVHLFDWDEINFAESAREMIITGDYLTVQVNYQAFWEKPPLFIWFQVLSMKTFGINEFAARFPNALCGIATLLFLFFAGKKLVNKKFALLWVMAYGCSVLPFFYFKSGIIDPWFNLFIFAGLFYIYQYLNNEQYRLLNLIASATAIGLAVLTKGPVGFLLFGLTVFIYILIKRFKFHFRYVDIAIFLVIFSFVGGFWFVLQILDGNYSIIQEFIVYQIRLFQTKDAGHGGFLLYHFVVVLFGVFPISFFALKSFSKKFAQKEHASIVLFMKILLWVVLILFTIVKTKIVHYSSLAYFPLSFLGAYVLLQIIEKRTKFNFWLLTSLGFVSTIYFILISAFPLIDKYKDEIIESGKIKDDFAIANMQANVNWSGWEFLIGIIVVAGFIASVVYYRRKQYQNSIIVLFAGSFLFVFTTMTYIVPRIEKYSQNAAIEFFQSIANKDCYVTTIGYKSYAQYFYTNKQKPKNKNSYNREWLTKGDIDKPTYFIMKITRAELFFKNNPHIERLYEKNGFVMALRNK